jgi:hypothetical protein
MQMSVVSAMWQELPTRLRGRGNWHADRSRIKDCELMYDAATEIEALRTQIEWLKELVRDHCGETRRLLNMGRDTYESTAPK